MKPFAIAAIPLAASLVFILPAASEAQSAANANSAQAPDQTSTQISTQTSRPVPVDPTGSSYKVRVLPDAGVAIPFAANAPPSETADPLRFLSQDQMAAADGALAATADPEIRRDAALAGFDLGLANWSYRQLVCRALPAHLFLVYESRNGPGDVSIFSVAIPRGGSGRARVIPVARRGYSLFSPTLAIAAFNRIRGDEPENKSVDWLATGLCYAALAGAHPVLSSASKNSTGAAAPSASAALDFPPTLEIAATGDSTVHFVDAANERRPTEWALTFSQKGQLLAVGHFAAPIFAVSELPAK